MRIIRWIAVFSVALASVATQAQVHEIGKAVGSTPLPSGIEIKTASGVLRILALREDIVRFTMSASSKLPEDASWAVLPDSRRARVSVTPYQDASSLGFDTKLLQIRVARSDLAITVSDDAGHVILHDSRPVEFSLSDKDGDLGFKVTKTMPEDEHYFGLGDKTGPLDRRGGAYVMWNTDAYRFQEGTDPLYKSIPYFIADRAGTSYGLFLDNTWRTEFDFGKARRNEFSFRAEGGPLDYYFIYGPEPKQVVESYAWLTGTTPLPPLWSLGFQQSRYSYETEAHLRAVADRLRADRIPADALYMDIDYQIKNRPFTINPVTFPNFPQLVKDLARQHFHLVLITDLHIARAPGQNYAPYDSGMAGDEFVKNPDGSVYVGTVWPGPSVFPDFTRQQTREWWGTLYKQFYADGVAGFWNDMNEPSVFNTPTKTMPLDVEDRIDEPGFRPRTTTQREIHNIFGMQNARATFEGLLTLNPNQRPFVLTRATYAGGQRYGATWTGDNSSSWSHLRLSTPMLESIGLGGFYMVGDDIGGYAGSPQMDLLTKWIETGAFNPIFRDHTEKGSNDQEPWVGGPVQEAIRRKYIQARYRLLPYLYTITEEASRTGIPIMRPLFLEFPDATADKHPLDLDAGNEFLFGPDLLVAPPPFPDEVQDYSVLFPPVAWYDYWTGKKIANTETATGASVSTGATLGMGGLAKVEVAPKLDVLPVYVRAGSILPMEPLVESTDQKPDGPLELRVYPAYNNHASGCKGSLYQDDGISMNYKHGDYLRVGYSCQSAPGRVRLRIGAQNGSFSPWWSEIDVTIFGWQSSAAHAELDGKPLPGARYDAENQELHLHIPQNAAGEVLTVAGAQ